MQVLRWSDKDLKIVTVIKKKLNRIDDNFPKELDSIQMNQMYILKLKKYDLLKLRIQ